MKNSCLPYILTLALLAPIPAFAQAGAGDARLVLDFAAGSLENLGGDLTVTFVDSGDGLAYEVTDASGTVVLTEPVRGRLPTVQAGDTIMIQAQPAPGNRTVRFIVTSSTISTADMASAFQQTRTAATREVGGTTGPTGGGLGGPAPTDDGPGPMADTGPEAAKLPSEKGPSDTTGMPKSSTSGSDTSLASEAAIPDVVIDPSDPASIIPLLEYLFAGDPEAEAAIAEAEQLAEGGESFSTVNDLLGELADDLGPSGLEAVAEVINEGNPEAAISTEL